MAADVPPGGRSYVQTRFLATEDSSTLTNALCVLCTNVYLWPLPPPLRGPSALNELAQPIRVANSRFDRATSPVP